MKLLKRLMIVTSISVTIITMPTIGHAAFGDQTLFKGMQNQDVFQLQNVLKEKGFFHFDKSTGFYGSITTRAVKEFQEENGLIADGIAGPKTFSALDIEPLGKELLSLGDQGQAVKALQEKLKSLGFYKSSIDGIFGPLTETAVDNFQKNNDLEVDGLAGPLTKRALKDAKPKVSRNSDNDSSKTLFVKSTAYTAHCPGCSGITSTGVDLLKHPDSKVIAVDPDIIPLGSKVYVEGYGYAIAADTGGAIQGNRIDIFFPSKEKALDWGVQTIKVKILE